MTNDKTPTSVQDFAVLPLTVPPLPSFPKRTTHYLYLRPNAPRVPTSDTPRELFLVNIPVDTTEAHVRSLFADQLGGPRVEDVDFENVVTRTGKGIKASIVQSEGKKGKKRKRDSGNGEDRANEEKEVGLLPEIWDRQLHRTGSTAVVRFVDRSSAEMAIREVKRAIKSGREIRWPTNISNIPPLGLARYLSHDALTYPDPAILQASVDEYMAAFAVAETERESQLARQRSVPDEDGFITVTRGGKGGRAPAREELTKARDEEMKKKETERVKDDFYRFQLREKKKDAAKDLVEGFEKDRRQVEGMRKRPSGR